MTGPISFLWGRRGASCGRGFSCEDNRKLNSGGRSVDVAVWTALNAFLSSWPALERVLIGWIWLAIVDVPECASNHFFKWTSTLQTTTTGCSPRRGIFPPGYLKGFICRIMFGRLPTRDRIFEGVYSVYAGILNHIGELLQTAGLYSQLPPDVQAPQPISKNPDIPQRKFILTTCIARTHLSFPLET